MPRASAAATPQSSSSGSAALTTAPAPGGAAATSTSSSSSSSVGKKKNVPSSRSGAAAAAAAAAGGPAAKLPPRPAGLEGLGTGVTANQAPGVATAAAVAANDEGPPEGGVVTSAALPRCVGGVGRARLLEGPPSTAHRRESGTGAAADSVDLVPTSSSASSSSSGELLLSPAPAAHSSTLGDPGRQRGSGRLLQLRRCAAGGESTSRSAGHRHAAVSSSSVASATTSVAPSSSHPATAAAVRLVKDRWTQMSRSGRADGCTQTDPLPDAATARSASETAAGDDGEEYWAGYVLGASEAGLLNTLIAQVEPKLDRLIAENRRLRRRVNQVIADTIIGLGPDDPIPPHLLDDGDAGGDGGGGKIDNVPPSPSFARSVDLVMPPDPSMSDEQRAFKAKYLVSASVQDAPMSASASYPTALDSGAAAVGAVPGPPGHHFHHHHHHHHHSAAAYHPQHGQYHHQHHHHQVWYHAQADFPPPSPAAAAAGFQSHLAAGGGIVAERSPVVLGGGGGEGGSPASSLGVYAQAYAAALKEGCAASSSSSAAA